MYVAQHSTDNIMISLCCTVLKVMSLKIKLKIGELHSSQICDRDEMKMSTKKCNTLV